MDQCNGVLLSTILAVFVRKVLCPPPNQEITKLFNKLDHDGDKRITSVDINWLRVRVPSNLQAKGEVMGTFLNKLSVSAQRFRLGMTEADFKLFVEREERSNRNIVNVVMQVLNNAAEPEMKNLFKKLDHDGNGKISCRDISELRRNVPAGLQASGQPMGIFLDNLSSQCYGLDMDFDNFKLYVKRFETSNPDELSNIINHFNHIK